MIASLLRRIGAPDVHADAAGLATVHRAFLERIPYEDTAVQLGESGPLDETALAQRVLAGRGGYCFELNTVLAALLRGLGFAVTCHEAVVGGEGPVNHMALLVELDGERWIADAGLGEGFLAPLPLRAGRHDLGPLWWTIAPEPGGTWWIGQHQWGSVSGFRMADAPSPHAAFAPHHLRTSTDPSSSFVRALVVQWPKADRIVTLRSRTLSERGPAVDWKRVLDRAEFSAALDDVFGLRLDAARIDRLWALAAAQHEAFLARREDAAA